MRLKRFQGVDEKKKNLIKLSLKVVVSTVLLSFFFLINDKKLIQESFFSVHGWLWVWLFLLYVVSQLLSSIRWFLIVRALGVECEWIQCLIFYFYGMFFNLFLPTGIGGDIVKGMSLSYLKRKEQRYNYLLLSSFFSVVVDRVLGLISLLVLSCIVLLFQPDLLPSPFSDLLVGISAGGAGLLCSIPLFERWLLRQLNGKKKSEYGWYSAIPQRWRFVSISTVRHVMDCLITLKKRPMTLINGVVLSLGVQCLCICICILLSRAMNIEVSALVYFVVFPLVTLLTILPVSFNGIGIREGGFVYFLGLYGVLPSYALMLSICFFCVQILASIVGGILYFFDCDKMVLLKK